MSVLERLKKNSTIKETDVLEDSEFFQPKDYVTTSIPMLNVALSGSLTGGFASGLGLICGPSKHFKTLFCLLLAQAYLKKYPDGVMLFYDSEFGSPQAYFESLGIDTNRVIHTPITNIEELKHDLMNQLAGIEKKDRVIIVIDSVGNLASKKEVDDALEGKSVADMTRAKQLKSLFRMVTPILTIKDIPMMVVNHVYQTLEMFSTAKVSGGQGIYLSSDFIWILGRQQEKGSDKELLGYNFIINIEKSRHAREKSKVPISVTYEGGINKWSGLLDVALEGGFIIKPKAGRYAFPNNPEKTFREKDTNNEQFWNPILNDKEFHAYIEKNFKVSSGNINGDISMEDIQDEFDKAEMGDSTE